MLRRSTKIYTYTKPIIHATEGQAMANQTEQRLFQLYS